MGIRDFFSRKPPPSVPAPAAPPLTPEQRAARTRIAHHGVTFIVPLPWTLSAPDPEMPDAIDYRNTALPEQLIITPRHFRQRLTPDLLKAALVQLAEHTRDSIKELSGPSAQLDEFDIRSGNGQTEVRLFARTPELQAAILHRGDAGRAVTISLYRYIPQSKLDLTPYATTIFDLVQFDATPA